MDMKELKSICCDVREDTLKAISKAASGHTGGALSATEGLVALYFHTMNVDPRNPKWEKRDRFILSKGHSAPAYYAVLAEKGYFPKEELSHLRQLGAMLQGHPDSKHIPGVDATSGSLGQGLAQAVGMAIGLKMEQSGSRVYAMCGDGELQEGIIWEASMAAAHYKLDNLTVLIDNNRLQIDGSNDEVMSLGNLRAKLEAFGYSVDEVEDGNDIAQVCEALDKGNEKEKPRAIILHTIKGKGVSFMEDQVGWHGKAPNAEQLETALKEIEEARA